MFVCHGTAQFKANDTTKGKMFFLNRKTIA